MKAFPHAFFVVACIFLAIVLVLSPLPSDGQELRGANGAQNYLPSIHKPLPTETPTAVPTPTPVPTPRGQLQDGYYEATFDNGGAIWFTVRDEGTVATDAGFDFKREILGCGWHINLFEGYEYINEGHFEFLELGSDFFPVASLECEALSSTNASCRAADRTGNDICAWITGVAERQ